MAERLAPGDYDQLHHFVAAGVWDAAPLETELLIQADRLVGGSDAVLVIDDTAMPKKGTHSVGVAAQYAVLASAQWRTMSWRSGTKGRLKARFAAVRVRTADGPPQRIWDKGQQHLPGDEAWLIGEHRASGEKKYYLANLAPEWTSAA